MNHLRNQESFGHKNSKIAKVIHLLTVVLVQTPLQDRISLPLTKSPQPTRRQKSLQLMRLQTSLRLNLKLHASFGAFKLLILLLMSRLLMSHLLMSHLLTRAPAQFATSVRKESTLESEVLLVSIAQPASLMTPPRRRLGHLTAPVGLVPAARLLHRLARRNARRAKQVVMQPGLE